MTFPKSWPLYVSCKTEFYMVSYVFLGPEPDPGEFEEQICSKPNSTIFTVAKTFLPSFPSCLPDAV